MEGTLPAAAASDLRPRLPATLLLVLGPALLLALLAGLLMLPPAAAPLAPAPHSGARPCRFVLHIWHQKLFLGFSNVQAGQAQMGTGGAGTRWTCCCWWPGSCCSPGPAAWAALPAVC